MHSIHTCVCVPFFCLCWQVWPLQQGVQQGVLRPWGHACLKAPGHRQGSLSPEMGPDFGHTGPAGQPKSPGGESLNPHFSSLQVLRPLVQWLVIFNNVSFPDKHLWHEGLIEHALGACYFTFRMMQLKQKPTLESTVGPKVAFLKWFRQKNKSIL